MQQAIRKPGTMQLKNNLWHKSQPVDDIWGLYRLIKLYYELQYISHIWCPWHNHYSILSCANVCFTYVNGWSRFVRFCNLSKYEISFFSKLVKKWITNKTVQVVSFPGVTSAWATLVLLKASSILINEELRIRAQQTICARVPMESCMSCRWPNKPDLTTLPTRNLHSHSYGRNLESVVPVKNLQIGLSSI